MKIQDWFANNTTTDLDNKLEALRQMRQQLECKAKDIQDEVGNEELRAQKRRKSEVSLWLDEVSKFVKDAQSIGTEVEQVSHHSHGNLLEKMMERGKDLLKQSEFSRGLLLDDLNPKGLRLVPDKMEGSTPSRVQDEVWNCFKGGKTWVGVYGMGGVGKTTVAMHINNKILEPNDLFERVYYVTVSRDSSVFKLQDGIAEAFGVHMRYQDEPKRAGELSDAMRKRKKCLLILDDVWEDISMSKVGVSVEDDGCKLLITTRKIDVIRKMNCIPVKLEPLSKDESWDLFMKEFGNYESLSDEAKDIARLVAEECDGLPLGIITVAGSMRGERSEHVWRDALRTLKSIESSSQIEMEEKVFSILRFSYDRLCDDKHRRCFLLCALYPEDYKIAPEELISLFISVGLVDVGNRLENIDSGHTLLKALVNASLLEHVTNFDGRGCVKMHDLVRDMAIKEIGASGMVKGGNSLRGVPREVEWNDMNLELVSLIQNLIKNIGGMNSLDCPKLSVLLLQRNWGLEMISNSFFVKMIGLKVLNLSDTGIKVLPTSVSSLVNLNSLLLSGCGLLKSIPPLGKLTSLREMNLEDCESLVKFPDGMEELVRLELLNIKNSGINGKHEGILCKLGNLQVFLNNYDLIVPLEELMSLRYLERCCGVVLADVSWLNRCADFGCFDQWTCYDVLVGCCTLDRHEYEGRIAAGNKVNREIKFEGLLSIEQIVSFPHNAQLLEYCNCNFRVRSLLDAFPSLYNATKLEFCILSKCQGIEYIIPDEWSKPIEGIHRLELIKMYDFVGLIREEVVKPHISFGGLKRLVIGKCPNVKRLWLLNLELPNLEEIHIESCGEMEEVFATANGETIKLPKLHSLRLHSLPKLRSIWGNADVFCPHLARLMVSGCREVKKLRLLSHNMLSLEHIHVSSCRKMEEIFAVQDDIGHVQLPSLKEVELLDLPELRSIFRNTAVCNSLQLLNVRNASKLDNCPISRQYEINSNDPPPRVFSSDWTDWLDSINWKDLDSFT